MTQPAAALSFEAPTPEHIGELFPSYDIVGLVACGGMGAVYQAVQRSLERPVAIKVLPRAFGGDASFRQAFEAEAKAMARLNHPNLIGVYDFGEVDGMLYIIMEYVGGGSLYHAAGGEPVDPKEAARLVAAVCDGLAHAHSHGILHRDIKPANILLDHQVNPKIGDFGLARPIGQHEDGTETIFGTPHYTAPEVLNRPTAVDARADIFSVGVVLHELLTGKVPAADARVPSMICGCDIAFDTIVRTATHPMSEMRYPSAAAMAQDLHLLVASLQQVSAAPSHAPRPMRRPTVYRRAKQSGGLGVIPTLLILAGVIALAWFIMRKGVNIGVTPQAAPVAAPVVTETPAPEPEQRGSALNIPATPIYRPDTSTDSGSPFGETTRPRSGSGHTLPPIDGIDGHGFGTERPPRNE